MVSQQVVSLEASHHCLVGLQALQVEADHPGAVASQRDLVIAVAQPAEQAGQLTIGVELGNELQIQDHPPWLHRLGIAVGLRVRPTPRGHELVAR